MILRNFGKSRGIFLFYGFLWLTYDKYLGISQREVSQMAFRKEEIRLYAAAGK